MKLRLAKIEDLEKIEEIYSKARTYMKSQGNQNQWKDNKPYIKDIINDINSNNLYVFDNGHICGVFALIIGIDPTYKNIYCGSWLNDQDYGTIHRIASDGTCKGIFDRTIDFVLTKVDNIRIDTHENNRKMISNLKKRNFVYCGIIKLMDGQDRLAFQLVKND